MNKVGNNTLIKIKAVIGIGLYIEKNLKTEENYKTQLKIMIHMNVLIEYKREKCIKILLTKYYFLLKYYIRVKEIDLLMLIPKKNNV